MLGRWVGGEPYTPELFSFAFPCGCLPPWLNPSPPLGVGQMVPASLGVGACLFISAPPPSPPPWLRKGFPPPPHTHVLLPPISLAAESQVGMQGRRKREGKQQKAEGGREEAHEGMPQGPAGAQRPPGHASQRAAQHASRRTTTRRAIARRHSCRRSWDAFRTQTAVPKRRAGRPGGREEGGVRQACQRGRKEQRGEQVGMQRREGESMWPLCGASSEERQKRRCLFALKTASRTNGGWWVPARSMRLQEGAVL